MFDVGDKVKIVRFIADVELSVQKRLNATGSIAKVCPNGYIVQFEDGDKRFFFGDELEMVEG